MMKKNDKQPDLFSCEEYEELQSIIKENYRSKFEREKYVFVENSADTSADWGDCKRRGVLQDSIFEKAQLEDIDRQVNDRKVKEELAAKKRLEKAVIDAQRQMVLPYFSSPKNDNELLLNLQYEYCKTGSEKVWGELLTNSLRVLRNLMKNYTMIYKVYLDDIEQDEKIFIALVYVMRRYKERVGWCVRKNFILALRDGLFNHAMKYKTMADTNVSYEEQIKCLDSRK